LARKTNKTIQVTPELLSQVSKENKNLIKEFIEFLKATSKSATTIAAYESDLNLFLVWNVQNNDNKFFVDFTKRDIMKYQNFLVNELMLSPNRVRRRKATISSLSNFIESMMDDIYVGYKPIVNKVPSPPKQEVREKTVLEDEQIDKLLDVLVEQKQYQKACVLALALASGARKSELLRFKIEYFTDENLVLNSLYKTPEKIKTKGHGKGKFLNKYVIKAKFKPYFDLWMKQREELSVDIPDLFVNKRLGVWKPLEITGIDSYAETFTKLLGVDFYFHACRHYFTTALCKCNIPASVIKKVVGWDNVAMVDVYNDQEVDDELGKYFDPDGIKKLEEKGFSDIK
jgi:integrase